MWKPAALLACAILSACSTQQPAPLRPDHLFNDALFPARPAAVDRDAFALSESMRRYLEVEIATQLRRSGRLRGLVDALQTDARLKLEYDASVTGTAAEAFEARAGNCLALVIMTAALAKELGLPVYYQRVYSEEFWTRDGDIRFRSGHVNVVLGERPVRRQGFSDGTDQITIDFLPQESLRGQRTREIEEHTIVAMFMNNRAAESLARGELGHAYWWAREAVTRDSRFMESYNTLGVIYSRRGNLREAERVFDHVLESEPENATVISNLAAILRKAGRMEAAQSLLEKLQRIEPYPPFHFFELAQLAMKSGDFVAARDLYAKELDRNPYYDAAHFGLAVSSFRMGDIRSAAEHLSAAMESSTTRRDRDLYAAKLRSLRSE